MTVDISVVSKEKSLRIDERYIRVERISSQICKRLMKAEFVVKRMQSLNKEIFSLSNCDMTTAKEFITYLIDFIIEYDIPTKQPLSKLCEDINKYIYMCLLHKSVVYVALKQNYIM